MTTNYAHQTPNDLPTTVERKDVIVHVTFLKVGEINTLKEAFDADVLVRTKWREPKLDAEQYKYNGDTESINWDAYWNPKVFIENALGEPKTTVSHTLEFNVNGEAFIMERKRFKGTYMEQMELWEFPFDLQDLTVIVMSDIPATDIKLVDDPDEVHKIYKQSFIDEQEFYLYKYIESHYKEMQKDRADPFQRRCAITVMCKAARRPWYFVWNHFSVTFLICCLGFVTFSVDASMPQNRLQLAFTLILTTVAFKFVVGQNLPRISYLTYLDRYILAAMVVISSICFWHATHTLLRKHHYEFDENIVVVALAGLYIIYNVQFGMRLILVPFKKRRQIARLEAEYIYKNYTARHVDQETIRKRGEMA